MGTVPKDPNRLEGAIRSTRAELDQTLGELRGAMSSELDWRTWVTRHPWPTLGLAMLVGLRLGRGRWI
jgi:hypothetical protein